VADKPLKTVLAIDDEQDICEIMADLLMDAGYKTVTATDGVEGIRKSENQDFDLVITDLKMPKKSGVDVIKAVRERDRKKGRKSNPTPIIVLSGNIDTYKPELAMVENVHLFHKPFDQNELKLLVNSLLKDSKLVYTGPSKEKDDLIHLVSMKINEVLSIIIKEKGELSKQDIGKGPKVVEGSYIIQNAYSIDKVKGRIVYTLKGELGDKIIGTLAKGKKIEKGSVQAFQMLHVLGKALVTKTSSILQRKYKVVKTGKLHIYGEKLYIPDGEKAISVAIKTKYGELVVDNAIFEVK
jgi:DNA-binding response OmpR family regulator